MFYPFQLIPENGTWTTLLSDTGYLQPKSIRSANNQVCAFEKLIRQIENLSKISIIPKFTNNRKNLALVLLDWGLMHKLQVSRVGLFLCELTKPCCKFEKYHSHLKGISKLDEPFCEFTNDPIILFLDYEEFDPRQRFNKAEVLRRFNKRRGGVEDVNS